MQRQMGKPTQNIVVLIIIEIMKAKISTALMLGEHWVEGELPDVERW